MNILSQNTRYLPHDFKTKLNAVKTYRNGNTIDYVCRKYHISRTSLLDKFCINNNIYHFEMRQKLLTQ